VRGSAKAPAASIPTITIPISIRLIIYPHYGVDVEFKVTVLAPLTVIW